MEEQNSQSLSPAGTRPPTLRDVLIEERISPSFRPFPMRSPTLRDFMAVFFRHWVLIVSAFLAILLGVTVVTWMLPKTYETQLKILVKRERPDPIVTTEASSQPIPIRDVTQEDLNSEVELLKSRDLLENVVLSCGLHKLQGQSFLGRLANALSSRSPEPTDQDLSIPRAVRDLEKSLEVELVSKSKLIEVRYQSHDPHLAAKVLDSLSALYLEKHLAVHRPAGALDFFQEQADEYRKGLQAAEKRLAEFSRRKGVVSIDIQRDIALRKQSDFDVQFRESRAAEAALEQRIKSLETQAASTPQRVVTQVRTSDNAALLQDLKSTLLTLELKRTELLTKFEPGYRAVQEVEQQIAQARAALAQAEKNSIRDETTDLDRTRQWLDEELARARAELVTQRARSAELAKSVEAYGESASQIGTKEIEHQDLVRAAKTAEANYLMYLRKQEEARISDALDRQRIVNVAIAEAPTVPALPSSPRWGLNLVLGFVLAVLISLGLAFAADYMDPSFRTPDEVEGYLGLPVLAATPRAD